MSTEREPIAVIGTGYVGLVTAAGFASLGSEVFCVDIDADKVARLERGEIPIYEPGLAELVAEHRERLHFSTELAPALERARLLFVAVGTPPTYSGDADLSAVHAVVEAMPVSDRHALVMKSTVPVGTGRAVARAFAERGKAGFRYVSCPEFLKEGTAVKDFLEPDRVVVGDTGDWAGDAVVALYEPLGAPLVRTDIASAEMVKLASNAFLATKISFINEIANVCEETGADVTEVARGMGLDDRIGPKFLQAGIGFGGSCFAGEETVLARLRGHTTLIRLEDLWRRMEAEGCEVWDGMIEPDGLEVLSWVPGDSAPRYLPAMCLTRREYSGEMVEVRTKMGRRLHCTADHGMLVSDGRGGLPEYKLAGSLSEGDWLPLGQGLDTPVDEAALAPVMGAVAEAVVGADEVIVRLAERELASILARSPEERREVFTHPRGMAERCGDVRRTRAVRLDEVGRANASLEGASIGTARNGAFVPTAIAMDEDFWRIVGLYLAEGHLSVDGVGGPRHRLSWSLHPSREQHLVDEVMAFWMRHGVRARVRQTPTARVVTVSSRLLGDWWTGVLGLGRNAYEQRLPDWIWDRGEDDKWALLSGLWEGDGSWSLVNGGPSVVLSLGTVSDELADGVMRLLGDLRIVSRWRVGRTRLSTKDTHWISVTGADQIERAIWLVPERDRVGVLSALEAQTKRIAPTGSRSYGGATWLRVTDVRRERTTRPVYSLEVPASHMVLTRGSLACLQCFPKDVSALKQLAGNSGYHFQLLNAVIEVNELQKRRVIGKLHKHLGTLVGKRIALLGLAFKPNTDDMREASSLVLAARLQADGAIVSAFDPVAEDEARELMPGLEYASGALEAVAGSDAVVLVTEWDQFRQLEWGAVADAMSGTLVVDGRNALHPDAIRSAGLVYEGVGRGSQTASADALG